jgi:hypothetical protein
VCLDVTKALSCDGADELELGQLVLQLGATE